MSEMVDTRVVTLLDAHGQPIEKPATFLTLEEAELLGAYQAFGAREGLQGTMKCNDCGKPMEVYVQGEIGLFCECRTILWRAS